MKSTGAAKAATYRCSECGWISMKWVGRCGECQAWGTIDEAGRPKAASVAAGPVSSPAMPISEIQAPELSFRPSGVGELDRVLGGGIVPGAVVLLAGEPGVGKSTLLLEVAARSSRMGTTTLYVSGEESASQVRLRAERTGALESNLFLAAEIDLAAIITHINTVAPDLLVIDSIQTIVSGDIDGAAGGVTQVRAVTAALVRIAKERNLPTVLVGHVTKDGAVAGPRALEHVVDVVLQFEGDRESRLRMLRATKNRFGPVEDLGCFDLGDDGIVEVDDPSELFVARHPTPVPGSCITVSIQGRRPMIAEVQALVGLKEGQTARRAVSGIDSSRLAMLIAVLQRHARLELTQHDVYAATVGGAVLRNPSADLAICVALASAALDVVLAPDTVVIGEVGLAGELRRVPDTRQRLAEAARLGFTRALIPADRGQSSGAGNASANPPDGIRVVDCGDLRSALDAVRGTARQREFTAPKLRVVT